MVKWSNLIQDYGCTHASLDVQLKFERVRPIEACHALQPVQTIREFLETGIYPFRFQANSSVHTDQFFPSSSEVLFGYSTSQTMDVNTFMILYWYHSRRSNRNKRKYWVHAIVKQRFYVATFQTLMCQLRSDNDKFFNYFRMSMTSFDIL
jgi:hypothetical protein